MTVLLEVEGVSRRFGGLLALKDVSFKISKGEIVGLIGPNGAGKTTCFNVVSGVLRPTAGDVRFHGQSITGVKPSKIVAKGLVRTFQSTTVFPQVTVLENVVRGAFAQSRVSFLGGLFSTASARAEIKRVEDRARAILDRLALDEVSEHLAASLPYGFQRRLGVAIALAAEPELLLLDEPAAGLNPEETIEMGRTIESIHNDGEIAVLLVEHHMRLVMGVSHRIIVLDHGEKLAEGTPEEIQSNKKVIEAYLGAEEVI